ncbi:hypothetical protein LEP1GSC074_3034 [Leptospira noguchii str. Hook]|nr:hypothetical protein LEP1GSC074_3034 [Leptospira noguchii str. Hook]
MRFQSTSFSKKGRNISGNQRIETLKVSIHFLFKKRKKPDTSRTPSGCNFKFQSTSFSKKGRNV